MSTVFTVTTGIPGISSENSSNSTTDDPEKEEEMICRDFLRNVCNRPNCKFIHTEKRDIVKFEIKFCHDYQHNKCNRHMCRFIHCKEADERYFWDTGKFTSEIIESMVLQGILPQISSGPGDIPICKDFLKVNCLRKKYCKFQHITRKEFEKKLGRYSKGNTSQLHQVSNSVDSFHEFKQNNKQDFMFEYEFDVEPKAKRRHYRLSTEYPLNLFRDREHLTHNPFVSTVFSNPRFMFVEEENIFLRRKIEELNKKVSDLTATNEFLLDQNAQLRIGTKRATNVTAVTVPAVTITNTGAPTMQVQPITAQIQPAQGPTPQQMVNAAVAAGTLRTVTATVPVSIATVTPVSISAVSMAPVQIPPPVVTMAQQNLTIEGPPAAPPQQPQQQNPQQAGPQSLPLSISGGTAPMVSYPIMTQELRPVLQTSLPH